MVFSSFFAVFAELEATLDEEDVVVLGAAEDGREDAAAFEAVDDVELAFLVCVEDAFEEQATVDVKIRRQAVAAAAKCKQCLDCFLLCIACFC